VVLALLAHNITQLSPGAALPALLATLAGVGMILGGFYVWLRDWQRAALIAAVFILLAFSYGHVYKLIKSFAIGSFIVGRHRYLLALWLAIAAGATAVLAKRPRDLAPFTRYLNIVGLILVCLPLYTISDYQIRQHAVHLHQAISAGAEAISLSPGQPAPDIYYIVLDAYARTDVLQQVYGIDNHAFLSNLQELGFQIVPCSRSNYNETFLSFTSTFNMNYLQSLPPYDPHRSGRPWLGEYLRHNPVQTLLEGLGYRTVVFYNVYETLLWSDAEVYKAPSIGWMLNPFETLLLQTTPGLAWLDSSTGRLTDRDKISRLNTLYALSQLPAQIPALPGPKFVFVHLIIPHPPFVFGPDGEEIRVPYDPLTDTYAEDDFWRGYRDQVLFINKQIVPLLSSLIEHSATPPVIVLASDHGTDHTSNVQNDFLNLEAYYLPGNAVPLVYDTMTPVNIFRVIFNTYFNGHYPLLPDKSYLCDETATHFLCTEVFIPDCSQP